jgi:RNA polymerase sigma-70 factor (ECF subfamily)
MSHGTTTELTACLDRLRAGDPQARAALIDRALDRLRLLARRQLNHFGRVHRFEDTDDVLQTALLRLLRRLEAHTPATPAEFFAIAAREVRCVLLDLIRHYYGPHGPGRREAPPPAAGTDSGTAPPPAVAPPAHDPRRLVQWTEFHEQAERLPAAERCVFELRWYHGLTWPEVAAVLNLSEATVKRHWVNARLLLRERLTFDLGNL